MAPVERFLADLSTEGKAASTLRTYGRVARDFFRWAEESGYGEAEALPPGMGLDYLAYLRTVHGLKPSSLATAQRSLRAFERWALPNGILTAPLLPLPPAPRTAPVEPAWLISFKQWAAKRQLARRTLANYVSVLRDYAVWLQRVRAIPFQPAELTLIDAGDYKRYLLEEKPNARTSSAGLKPSAVNRAVAALRVFAKWAHESGATTHDALSGLKQARKLPTQGPRWLERTEQNRLIREVQLIPQQRRRKLTMALVRLMMQAGLRVQEVINLQLTDVTLDPSHEAALLIRDTKGGRSRTVELGNDVRRTLKDWLDVRRAVSPYLFPSNRSPQMTTRAVQHIITGLAARTKLGHRLTCHALRHTCGHELYVKGWDLGTIASYLGHFTADGKPNIQMVVIYTHPGSADRRRAARSLDWDSDSTES